jgi:hypothetical protein
VRLRHAGPHFANGSGGPAPSCAGTLAVKVPPVTLLPVPCSLLRSLPRISCCALSIAIVGPVLAGTLAAQTIDNPRSVVFAPSPDHSLELADGVPVVSAYLLQVYQVGAAQPFQTTSMGKPSVQSDGLIHYDFSAQVAAWPLPGGSYEARVDAVGPYGYALSSPSNAFTLSVPATSTCTFVLSKASTTVGSASGIGSIGLSTQSGCAWSAASSASWLTLRSTGGTGSATLSYSFTANTSTTVRSGKIAVGGALLTVTQSGAACSYSVSPTTRALASGSGTDQVGLTTASGCRWTASSSASWITLATTSGYGSATVKFAFGSNTSASSRSGSLSVGGRAVSVTQAGTCSYSLSKSSTTFTSGGGSGSVGVTTGSACTWKAASSASWLVPSKTSGTGSATVGYTAARNASTSPRSASLTIGGKKLSVSQSGSCTYSLSKYTASLASGGGTGSVGVTAGASCAWKAASSASWLVPSKTSGTGSATVGYTAARNASTSPRSASLTIGGKKLTVSQSGSCTYSLSKYTASISSSGGSGSVGLTTGASCTWRATSSAGWLVPSKTSGTGGSTIGYTAAANASTTSRSASLTVGGRTLVVSQPGTATR